MKRRLGNNGERRKQLRKHDHNSQLHSRLEAKRQRRRRQWLIQQEKEREHEKLKQKMILEHKLKRGYEKGASHSKGKLANRSNSKSNNSIKYIKTRSSKSSAIPGKSDTLCGTTSLFKGPEGIQISEKELHCIKVDIHRNIPVKGQMSELQRDIINPEDVIIIRRSGEGSKPIFEREEINNTSKKIEEIEERCTVIAVESGDSVSRSESFRRRSPSSNSLRHRSQRSSSYRWSKSKDSKDSSCKFDYHTSRKSDRRQNKKRSRERRKKYKEHNRPSSRYRSSRNKESSSQEYRDHRRDSYSRNESRKEEGSSSSSKSRNRSIGNRERERRSRTRSRSHSRSRDNRYRERQMVPSHCIDQVPYPVYYGPRSMMVEPMMPIARDRLPPSVMEPMRPFPSRLLPSNVYRLDPLFFSRSGSMFQCEKL